MKNLMIILLSTALAVAAFFFLKPDNSKANISYPWQIKLHPDGTSTVFGLHLKVTAFNNVHKLLGIDHDIAVLVDKQDNASLEMYYRHFSAGPLAGKLIIAADAQPGLITLLAENAIDSEYLKTGSRKFTLAANAVSEQGSLRVKSLTFVPIANLDHEVIADRFGEPAQIVDIDDNSQRYLYPDKGLVIELNKKGKEALHYMAPGDFALPDVKSDIEL